GRGCPGGEALPRQELAGWGEGCDPPLPGHRHRRRGNHFPFGDPRPDTGILDAIELSVPLIRDGEPVDGLPTLEDSRQLLADRLVSLPWEGLALSRDEPVISVRHVPRAQG